MAQEANGLTDQERLRVLEIGQKVLTDQMADIAVENRDMGQRIEEAVTRGVQAGLEAGLPRALEKLIEQKKREAAEGTGRWLWGVVKDTVIRWGLILALVISIGKFAGWPLAAQVWDAITGAKK